MNYNKRIILVANAVSTVFTPFYLPLVGLAGLLTLTYLSLLPLAYKAFLVVLFWLFTVFLPTTLIRLYRRYRELSILELLGNRERRAIPYVASIMSYMLGYYIIDVSHVPHFMGSILIAALVIQIGCAVVNMFVKVSTHTAAIGGVGGALAAFSLIFSFNPVWWLCLVIFMGGVVGTSRMILRQHSLHEVVLGFLLGAACAFVAVLVA